jgi:hypothetical protein
MIEDLLVKQPRVGLDNMDYSSRIASPPRLLQVWSLNIRLLLERVAP